MLFSTQLTTANLSRWYHLGGCMEHDAEAAAGDFTARTVAVGAVRQHGRYMGFSVAGMIGDALSARTVIIPEDMPEADAWCTWVATLELCGLKARVDRSYEQAIFAADDHESHNAA